MVLAIGAMIAPNRLQADTLYFSSLQSLLGSIVVKVNLDGSTGTGTLFAASSFGFGDLALDGAGNLFVTDAYSYIHRFTPDRVQTVVPGPAYIGALTFDNAGNLWGTTTRRSGVVELPQGGGLPPLVSFDYTTVRLAEPRGIAFDREGNLYVANHGASTAPGSAANTIVKVSPAGVDLGLFAEDGAISSGRNVELQGPWDLVFDSVGRLYVSCTDTDTIERFAADGLYLGAFATGLSDPKGMAFDSAGNLYVANSGDGTIRKFTTDGVGLVVASGLSSPGSLVILRNVPEPSALALLAFGGSAMLGIARLRVKVTAAP